MAAICRQHGAPLVLEEIEVDDPGDGEVLVRLAASSICGSDLHVLSGEWKWHASLPIVAGHECAGRVEKVGPGATNVAVGDKVVLSLLRRCGQCRSCYMGQSWICRGTFAQDAPGRVRAVSDGAALFRGLATAGFSGLTVVHHSQVVAIEEAFPDDKAALLACGVITGFGAVANRARVRPLDSVVVIGTGGVGLNSVQAAALSGAVPVIAVDTSEERLEQAVVFGATDTLQADDRELVSQVRTVTDGGADHVFVTVGVPTAARLGFSLLGPRGTLVIVGIPPSGARLEVPVDLFTFDERQVTGTSMGSSRLESDVPRLVKLYNGGRLKLDELVTETYPFARINEALRDAASGHGLRRVVVFDG